MTPSDVLPPEVRAELQALLHQEIVDRLERAFDLPCVAAITLALPCAGQTILTLVQRIQARHPETDAMTPAFTWVAARPGDTDPELASWELCPYNVSWTVVEVVNDAGCTITERLAAGWGSEPTSWERLLAERTAASAEVTP